MSQHLRGLFWESPGQRALTVNWKGYFGRQHEEAQKQFSKCIMFAWGLAGQCGGMELTDQQETSSHWDNKISALWVSMATGAPAVPLAQLVVKWPTCAKSLPASKQINALSLCLTVSEMAADETWNSTNYLNWVELARVLMDTVFLMDAVIFPLRRYIWSEHQKFIFHATFAIH